MQPNMEDTALPARKRDLPREYKHQVEVKKQLDNPLEAASRHRYWQHKKDRKRQKRLNNERAGKQQERETSSDDAGFWCW